MAEIIRLSEVNNNNRLITPAQQLRDLADAIDAGAVKANCVMAIYLDDTEDNYNFGWWTSNLSSSGQYALAGLVAQRIGTELT
jgi:hypothetical protein